MRLRYGISRNGVRRRNTIPTGPLSWCWPTRLVASTIWSLRNFWSPCNFATGHEDHAMTDRLATLFAYFVLASITVWYVSALLR
jgi:hypothetical protein